MARGIWTAGSGGGADLDAITATAADILKGKVTYVKGQDEPVEGELEIQSVVNFKAAQYSSLVLLCTWALPAKGPWSGLRIMCKQGSYPANINDGTLFYEGAAASATKQLTAGMWYFRAWNYINTNKGRFYGGYSQASANNQQIKGQQTFTTSGTFTVPAGVRSIDVFCVGGGGGGGYNGIDAPRYDMEFGGGGGGYTKTLRISVSPGQTYAITIGNGGGIGGAGGVTSFGNLVSAAGGQPGYTYRKTSSGNSHHAGGNGGSGGGHNPNLNTSTVTYSGGSDGSDGIGSVSSGRIQGIGQHSTTRAFGEDSGTLYSGGGGACIQSTSNIYTIGPRGGLGGGGNGANAKQSGPSVIPSTAGGINTGGGGGGGSYQEASDSYRVNKAPGAAGGSGICLVRWGY